MRVCCFGGLWLLLLLELFSASKVYGFERQPTGAQQSCNNAHVSRTACAGAAPEAPAFRS